MTVQSPLQVVNAYLSAVEVGDFGRARDYLADRGFQYRSPILNSNDADEFIANISHVGAIMQRIERRKSFVDGEDVCSILRFFTNWSTPMVTDTVQWFRVADGKIKSIETFFDARAYREMFVLEGD